MRGEKRGVEFLLTADVAREVGVTPDAIKQAARAGRIKVAGVTPGGVRLFRAEDVEAFMRRRLEGRPPAA